MNFAFRNKLHHRSIIHNNIMHNENIILFNKNSIYKYGEIILYGQYINKFNQITIETNKPYSIQFCNTHSDFFIKINDLINNCNEEYTIPKITFHYDNNIINYTNIRLEFPFETYKLEIENINLQPSKSAIISTICKNYSHRLDEWIQYNLKLGFSGIIIFNNDANDANGLNEDINQLCISKNSMKEIVEKYKNKVLLIDFPYKSFKNVWWNSLQQITLTLGVNAFKDKCKYIALIDADEFIYLPQTPNMNIEEFLEKYNTTVTMRSNILTNKNNNDIIDNNILQIAEYIGEDKYTKTILNTSMIMENEFVVTPHEHPSQIILDKKTIIHYHCWVNNRYNYHHGMIKINYLKELL